MSDCPLYEAKPTRSTQSSTLREMVTSSGDGYGHCYERNDEFCVTVGPVVRSVGILVQSVKSAGC